MKKSIISLILLLTSALPAYAATPADLKDTAPDRYIVVPGDTLWGIAGRYLKEPWRWQELWKMNQDQIKNPNRIYPGDVLVLDRGRTQLRVDQTEVRLSPKVRAEARAAAAVPTIRPTDIEPFLSRPLVVGATELDNAARIVATEESRVAIGAGNVAYVRGVTKEKGLIWQVFRRGDPLVDPDTKEILGYTANYLGEARVRQFGEISTVDILKSNQEMYEGDRLLPASQERPTFSYVPRPPQKSVRGRIVSAYNSIWETGPLSIVTLSKGAKDGLEVGHVLAIHRNAQDSRYGIRTEPLFGRQGPSGSDARRPYYAEELTPRDAPVFTNAKPVSDGDIANLPNERYGLVMVFRTFDRAAFGLVMQASRPVSLNDVVVNP